MKRRDQLKKLEGLATPELKQHISELGRELMNLRFRKSSRQLTNSAELRNTRVAIARAKTVLVGRERAQQ
jgi:ribosomal protein L29